MRRTAFAAFVVLAVAAVALHSPVASADRTFKVIVHPEVVGSKIPRQILSSIFLKEVARWGTGEPVHPVDQSMRSSVRAAFTEDVLARPFGGIAFFWAERIKKGVAPPPVKQIDADVISYVAGTKGAIGYVSISTPVPESVKTLSLIE